MAVRATAAQPPIATVTRGTTAETEGAITVDAIATVSTGVPQDATTGSATAKGQVEQQDWCRQ